MGEVLLSRLCQKNGSSIQMWGGRAWERRVKEGAGRERE